MFLHKHWTCVRSVVCSKQRGAMDWFRIITNFFRFGLNLSIQLGLVRVGCTVGSMFVNHLMFADGRCVFGRSISGLHCLLNTFDDYVAIEIFICRASATIHFNCNPVYCSCFRTGAHDVNVNNLV